MSDILSWDDAQAEHLQLPILIGEARAHSAKAKKALIEKIQQRGAPMPFSAYMSECLYAPALGYYDSGARIFNRGGDFVTAPSMGQLFGQSWARALQPLLEQFGGVLVEFGAGNGNWAMTIIEALTQLGSPPKAYHILELSSTLAARQRTKLATLSGDTRVYWHSSIETLPQEAIFLANEVLDAMPQERFVVQDGEVQLLGVDAVDTVLSLVHGVEDKKTQALLAPWQKYWHDDGVELAEGLVSEYSPYLPSWLAALEAHISSGLLYLIDYGDTARQYYLPERTGGTFIAHYQHRAHSEALLYPGQQDLSASVDFSAVAHFALESGLELFGFTTQAAFLMDNQILSLLERQMLDHTDVVQTKAQLQRHQEAKKLLMPCEMGERFKVMLLGKDADAALEQISGFAAQELSNLL